jgi:hypothetical protein
MPTLVLIANNHAGQLSLLQNTPSFRMAHANSRATSCVIRLAWIKQDPMS